MEIRIFDTPGDVADALARRIILALLDDPAIVLGLPTGQTPVATYAELRRLYAAGEADFSKASTFNIDEFAGVGASDPGSFRSFMDRHLFDAVNVRLEHIHFLNGAASDLEAECDRYEAAIGHAGGIDIQLLGIGANGHIGFNEPADTLISRTHRVTLTDSTRRDNAALWGDDLAHVPRDAVTMGMGTIMKAATVILIATGERKAQCVERTINGPLTTRLPASFLQLHRQVEVYLDREAASRLPRSG